MIKFHYTKVWMPAINLTDIRNPKIVTCIILGWLYQNRSFSYSADEKVEVESKQWLSWRSSALKQDLEEIPYIQSNLVLFKRGPCFFHEMSYIKKKIILRILSIIPWGLFTSSMAQLLQLLNDQRLFKDKEINTYFRKC